MVSIESRFLAAAACVATLVSARGALASNFVMGGYQANAGGAVLTEIETEFQVPNAPANFSSAFALWTGLTSNSTVIQAVLSYTDEGCESSCPHWQMQNEVENNGLFGRNIWVSPSDWILAYVYLDSNNTSGCDILNGAGCNYIVGWVDLSNTSLSDVGLTMNGGTDFTFSDAPNVGWGLVLETGTNGSLTFNNCTDFPQNAIGAETIMYTWSWTDLYNAVPTNLSLGFPGVPSTVTTFTNQSLTDGGHVVNTNTGNRNDCDWTCGVSAQSTNVGEITMGF